MGGFFHKTQGTWTPQWTSDESHVARMVSTEVQFFRAENLDRVAFRIHADNLGTFSISPGAYPKVAVFSKEAKVRSIRLLHHYSRLDRECQAPSRSSSCLTRALR